MTDRIETTLHEHLPLDCGFRCTCGWEVPAHTSTVYLEHTRHILDALKAARIAVVELAETQTDPEWGDEFWAVPLTGYSMDGKLRIETGRKSGPCITQTVVPNPLPVADVDAYVSALLAAKVAAEASQ